jgi:hypothetical protein
LAWITKSAFASNGVRCKLQITCAQDRISRCCVHWRSEIVPSDRPCPW